jgi:4-hydroxybenzoate polyprenyltransferase
MGELEPPLSDQLCYHSAMLLALLKTMRPKQWTKNGFIFAALIFDGQLTRPESVLITLAGFVVFCLLSSTVYIINDLVDLQADRQHPKKRTRPIASGELPIRIARIAVLVCVILVIPLSFLLTTQFALVALLYLLVNLVYSARLKHEPILDVLVLAGLYVLRVGAGVTLIEVARFSPWLYVSTIFLALYLGIGKRRAELNLLAGEANAHRPVLEGYSMPLLDQLITIVSSISILTYSIYTFSAENLPANHAMMLTIPFVIYGIFRYLYLLQVKNSGDAPEEVLLTDRPLQITLILWGFTILFIIYVMRV